MSDSAATNKDGGVHRRWPSVVLTRRSVLHKRVRLPPGRGAGWALELTSAAQFVPRLDFCIVKIALTSLQHELRFSALGFRWLIIGYARTYGTLALVEGLLSDLVGAREALVVGPACFAMSSLTCGPAMTPRMPGYRPLCSSRQHGGHRRPLPCAR
jgi:MFS family permease